MTQAVSVSTALRFERHVGVTKPDLQTIADAYIYLLGRVLVIRQEHVDLDQTGIDYNVVKYHPLGNADTPYPNFDVTSDGKRVVALVDARKRSPMPLIFGCCST